MKGNENEVSSTARRDASKIDEVEKEGERVGTNKFRLPGRILQGRKKRGRSDPVASRPKPAEGTWRKKREKRKDRGLTNRVVGQPNI